MQKSACQRGRFSVNTSLLLTNASRKRKPNGAAGHRKQSRTSPRQTENLASQHRLQLRVEGFPSGQREQTVNLSSMTSVVRIHHLPPKEPILIRVSVLFWCQVEWIRKPALRNVPVARFNRRGFAAAKRIHHRTGRQACSSAVLGLHQPITAGTRPIRREEQVIR